MIQAAEKRQLNARKAELNAIVRSLEALKKVIVDRVGSLKKNMKEARREVETTLGKLDRPTWEQIEEECFTKQGIEWPYFQASIKLLSNAQKILDRVKNFILMKVPEATRCPDHEVIKQINSSIDFLLFLTAFFQIMDRCWFFR